MLLYKVTKRYARGPESEVAKFKEQTEAIAFANEKFAEDSVMKVNSVYVVYEGHDVVATIDATTASVTSQGAGTQQSNAQSFSPNPFQTAPRPSGMPLSGLKDQDDDKKK